MGENLTRKQREAKAGLQKARDKSLTKRKAIANLKARADGVAHKVMSRKTDLTKLQQAEANARAATMAKIRGMKAKIAEVEAKRASAEEAIKQLNGSITQTTTDIGMRKEKIAQLHSNNFASEKENNTLKKKVSVL